MKRNYGIDLMRIFLCICVIGAHSLEYFGIYNDTAYSVVMLFLLQANGAFFLLSGYFNLEKKFNNATDIKKYYKHKLIYILLPFLAFVFVWTLWDYLHENGNFALLDFLKTYYETFMVKSSYDHMWFMYPLFGLLLSTPFLSKMLHNMDEKELKICWYIVLGWNAVCYYLCLDLNTEFAFISWIFDGWLTYYFAGYYYRHVIANESKTKWAIIGIVCFVLTNLGNLYLSPFAGMADLQPMFVLFCVSCLMFWDKVVNIKNEKIGKVILFISRNTFLIYLFHIRVMGYVTQKLAITSEGFISGMIVTIVTFIVSLIVAQIANLLMKPLQKLIDSKWVIKED